MIVTEIQVIPVKPFDGLVAFASCVIDGKLFLGSMGVHKRLNGSGYRITYPTKKIGLKQVNLYHPIDRPTAAIIEQMITDKCSDVLEKSGEFYDRHNQNPDRY